MKRSGLFAGHSWEPVALMAAGAATIGAGGVFGDADVAGGFLNSCAATPSRAALLFTSTGNSLVACRGIVGAGDTANVFLRPLLRHTAAQQLTDVFTYPVRQVLEKDRARKEQERAAHVAELLADFDQFRVRGWDGYGADPISSETLQAAAELLQFANGDWPMPDVAPSADGSIGFEWWNNEKHLFIDVTRDLAVIAFSDDADGSKPIEERISWGDAKLPKVLSSKLERLFGKSAAAGAQLPTGYAHHLMLDDFLQVHQPPAPRSGSDTSTINTMSPRADFTIVRLVEEAA